MLNGSSLNRDWVQRCLKEAAPASKDKVHGELKKVRLTSFPGDESALSKRDRHAHATEWTYLQVIFEAYRNKTINSTDWSSIELES